MARARALRSFGRRGMGLRVYGADAGPAAAAHLRPRPAHLPRDEVPRLRRPACASRAAARSARRDSPSCWAGRPLSSSSASSTSRCCSGSSSRELSSMSHHTHRGPRPRLRLPGRHAGARRRLVRDRPRRGGRHRRRERRRQVDAAHAPQRAADAGATGRVDIGGTPVTKGTLRRHPADGRHGLPGPGRPAVHADRRRGRRLRPAEPRPAAGGRRGARRRGAGAGRRDAPQGAAAVPALGRREARGGHRHGARDGAQHPRHGRAVVGPGPARAAAAHRAAAARSSTRASSRPTTWTSRSSSASARSS